MSDTALEVLDVNLKGLSSSLAWLNRSYERCIAIGIKAEYAEDEFDQFENLTSRYSRTVDLLINKVLRSIDTVEFYDGGSIIDAANRAEKRGIIDSVSALRDIKDLRNEIAHEYASDDLKQLFNAVLDATLQVRELVNRVIKDCGRYNLVRTGLYPPSPSPLYFTPAEIIIPFPLE
jgi:hypothetical protein